MGERAWAIATAREAAHVPFELRPSFGETHYFETCMLTPPGRFVMTAECDRKMREGMAADPNSPYLLNHFGPGLAEVGRFPGSGDFNRSALAQFPYDGVRLRWRWFTLAMEAPSSPGTSCPTLRIAPADIGVKVR